MKKTKGIYLALLVMLSPMAANADLIVTIGDVTDTNTVLSVSIIGGGTLSSDLWTGGTGSLAIYTDFSGTIVDTFPNTQVSLVGDGVEFFANNDIGNYVGGTYSNFTGERLVAGITVNNITDGTFGLARWLDIDDDGLGDDFAVILDSTNNSLFDAGDIWSVNGVSSMLLQRGNASDLTLGTYSYQDNALGMVTLIIRSGSAAAVPEPSTLALLGLGLVGMAARRRKTV